MQGQKFEITGIIIESTISKKIFWRVWKKIRGDHYIKIHVHLNKDQVLEINKRFNNFHDVFRNSNPLNQFLGFYALTSDDCPVGTRVVMEFVYYSKIRGFSFGADKSYTLEFICFYKI